MANARAFNGTSDQLVSGDPASGINFDGACSMFGHFRMPSRTTDSEFILAQIGSPVAAVQNGNMRLQYSQGPTDGLLTIQLDFLGSNGAIFHRHTVAGNLPVDTWFRAYATKNSNSGGTTAALIYSGYNGSESSSNHDPPVATPGGPVAIGTSGSGSFGGGRFNGRAAWFAFVQGVRLTAAQMDAYLDDPESLIADYGPTGTVIADALRVSWSMQCDTAGEADLSESGNAGTYTGTTWIESGGPTLTTEYDPCAPPVLVGTLGQFDPTMRLAGWF